MPEREQEVLPPNLQFLRRVLPVEVAPPDPHFSIVIPALNEAGYIATGLYWLSAQLSANDQINVVDNGSTDNTMQIAKEFGCTVVEETKPGASHARNKGAEVADNPILAFIDADGIAETNWLAEAKRSMTPDRISAVSGPNWYKSMARDIHQEFWYNFYSYYAEQYMAIRQVLGKTFLVMSNLAIRKDVFEELGKWEAVIGEDYWLSKKFAQHKDLHGSFNRNMLIYYPSRRFDQKGHVRTVVGWVWHGLKRTLQDQYPQVR